MIILGLDLLSGRQIGRLLFGICTLIKVIISEDWADALHDCPDGNSGIGRPIFSRILSPTAFRPPTRKSAPCAASRAEKHTRETACVRGRLRACAGQTGRRRTREHKRTSDQAPHLPQTMRALTFLVALAFHVVTVSIPILNLTSPMSLPYRIRH